MANYEEELLALFRTLHAHPELGFEEFETTKAVRQRLEQAGIELVETGLPTGVVCAIGHGEGRCIGLRADMDALPMSEEADLPYKSCVPGKMHACGHDFHTAAMLGAALLLKEREAELPGRALIVFQPAEELCEGARRVAETGVLDEPEWFFGIHSYPEFEAGTLGLRPGAVMASVDRFRVTLHGVGSHAASPHKGLDPIPVMAALIQSLQTIVSRSVNPFSPVLLSVTHAQAGTTWNIIPQEALIEGTVRTMDEQERAEVKERFYRQVEGVCAAWGAHAEIDWMDGSPAVINDPGLCALAESVAREMGFEVRQQEQTLGGEDFSEYLYRPVKRPGLFVRIGTGGGYAAHHPLFTVDPAALWPASQYIARLAEAAMKKQR